MRLPRFALNLLSPLLPPTRWFGLKRRLYRLSGLQIAEGVRLNSHLVVLGHGEVSIGSGTWVGQGTRFMVPPPASVRVGANCDIAPEVSFLCGSHELGDSSRRAGPGTTDDVEVGAGTWIGSRVLLLPGARVGRGCVIAAGAVVRAGTYPDDSLIAGNPAVVKRRYDP